MQRLSLFLEGHEGVPRWWRTDTAVKNDRALIQQLGYVNWGGLYEAGNRFDVAGVRVGSLLQQNKPGTVAKKAQRSLIQSR